MKITLENTEGATKREQSRETANIGYTRRRKTKKKLIIICAGHHYTETNTNNVNKTCALLLKVKTNRTSFSYVQNCKYYIYAL